MCRLSGESTLHNQTSRKKKQKVEAKASGIVVSKKQDFSMWLEAKTQADAEV